MRTSTTPERLRELFEYNADTGFFKRKKSGRGITVGRISGCIKADGYRAISVDRVQYPAHRLVLVFMTGVWPTGQIDHINGNKDDNTIKNLREVDQFTNMQNLRACQIGKTSTKLLGAYKNKKSGYWYSQIKVAGKNKHLGCFKTPETAHHAYVVAKRIFHKGCTL